MTPPLDTILKISHAMELLNHPSLDDSDEVNQAYNILENILNDLSALTSNAQGETQ